MMEVKRGVWYTTVLAACDWGWKEILWLVAVRLNYSQNSNRRMNTVLLYQATVSNLPSPFPRHYYSSRIKMMNEPGKKKWFSFFLLDALWHAIHDYF
jgi:hypothetical protein